MLHDKLNTHKLNMRVHTHTHSHIHTNTHSVKRDCPQLHWAVHSLLCCTVAYIKTKNGAVFAPCKSRKLLISRAPTKVKSQEPAYSQALNQNKIDMQWSRSRESGRQTVRRLWWMVLGVETGREVWRRGWIRI